MNSRTIDYLRISVTDRCNLRCMYCMPSDGIIHKPQDEILTFEEIVRLVRIFTSLGIKKIRLTGGEVLVRKDIVSLIKSLADIQGIEDISLTTNGNLLYVYAGELKKAGLKRINISLDTLRRDRFNNITGDDSIGRVFDGIDKARQLGFYPLKLNMVVMKGINDDEIIDFAEFAFSKNLTLRFIEFMRVTPLWEERYFIPIEEVLEVCKNNFALKRLGNIGPGPAVYYSAENGSILGFIKTDEDNCRICSRLRLTSTGELKSCLYETRGLLLRGLLRNGYHDEEIRKVIKEIVHIKQNTECRAYESTQLYMCSIGG